MRGRHVSLWIGIVLVGLVAVMAALSLVWIPGGPLEIDVGKKFQGPSVAHWLGTDQLGRDLLAQLMTGAQSSILVAFLSVGLGGAIGVSLGLTASAIGGWVEDGIMSIADIGIAFPTLLFAIMLSTITGPNLTNAVLAIAFFNVPTFARVSRGAANAIWTRDYVLAARAAGRDRVAITVDHVLPNIAAILIVQATIEFAFAILVEAGLSYLGLGVQPPTPSWGRMLAEAQTLLFSAPHLAIWPGVCIVITVLGFNMLGDGLRDANDPQLRRHRS